MPGSEKGGPDTRTDDFEQMVYLGVFWFSLMVPLPEIMSRQGKLGIYRPAPCPMGS